jgi:hypothetical protein
MKTPSFINFKKDWPSLGLPETVAEVLSGASAIFVPESRNDLLDWSLGREAGATNWNEHDRQDLGTWEVAFEVAGLGRVAEASVVKASNGVSVNYLEKEMRRRDPDAMVIGDALPTDKPTYLERFKEPFDKTRRETLDWLKKQELIVVPFYSGPEALGYGSLMICPKNAGFFAAALADLQGMIPASQVPGAFKLTGGVLYVAPPFRHTHFKGRQVVVHKRTESHQELFCYNLYPGPSAKKGVYSILLHLGEQEGWVTNHCAAVMVVTPYDNRSVIMHEGASGGGKSEMTGRIQRMEDGRLLLGRNLITDEERTMSLPEACHIYPMMDDMGVAHPSYSNDRRQRHLRVSDAEKGWFVRVDHINEYGTDPHLEKLSIQPSRPLLFLNHHVNPGGKALIWEHTEDAPGKPCPNPRLIIPRDMVPHIKDGPVSVNVRSFGVRCPPTHEQSKLYGILGMLQVLNPALAWLWRLVAPRGHANPSIQDVAGMQSEGVGSYWAFCTGRRVDQANLLLKQILETPDTRYVLIPNQHIGAWKVGFMAEWIAREYLARRGGAMFSREQLIDSDCPLLGYVPHQIQIEGTLIPRIFVEVVSQSEGGEEVFAEGARQWSEFFKKELKPFLQPDLDPLGRKIIQACLDDARQEDYWKLIPHPMFTE